MTIQSTTATTVRRLALVATALAALTACTTDFLGTGISREGINHRVQRNTEIAATRAWRNCRDDALVLDAQARKSASAARYSASARAFEACESLISDTSGIPEEERMQAYAVGVQNHLKGGDIVASRRTLKTFRSAFAGKDLLFPDGSSFSETMEMMLGLSEKSAAGAYSEANVSSAVKKEVRRLRYWKHM